MGAVSDQESSSADYYKAALGFWYHTKDFEDISGNARDKNHGIYFIAEKNVYAEESEGQGLGLFFQSGFTPQDRNQISSYYGAGFAYTGLIDCRDSDVLSFGFASARNGDDYLDQNPGFSRAETVYELTYRYIATEYLALQPDIQFVENPSTDPELDNAVVLGLRVEVAL